MTRHDNTFESRCPIVREEEVSVARLIDVSGGLDIYRAVRFSAPIKWLRESSATTVVRNVETGVTLHKGSTFCDFYGFLTAAREPVETVRGLMRQFGVTADGPLVVEAQVTVEDKPVVDGGESVWGDPSRAYRPIPSDWVTDDDAFIERYRALPFNERFSQGVHLSYLRARTVVDAHVIWSSRDSANPEAQPRGLEALRVLALEGLDAAAARKADEVIAHLAKLVRDGAAQAA